MTKVHIISLAILAASIAAPEAKEINWLASVPPVEYDRTYIHKLLIQRFSVKEKIPCKDGKLACAWRAKDGRWCYIALATDKLLATEHHTYASVMRHELGHCNGWSGHEHERRIPRDSIEAPGLPKDTQYFPTDDLASICFRLDGSPKTCEPDDKWSACETPTAEGRLQYCKRPARVVAGERTPPAAANPPAVKSSQQTNPPTAADPPAASAAADTSDKDRLIARTYKRCLAQRDTDDFKTMKSQKETEDYCGCFSVLINERVPKEEWQADMKAGTWVNNPKLIATQNYCSDRYLNLPDVKSILERKW